MAPSTSAFVDILPPELRLHIYTKLLVASSPLKGLLARGTSKYDLHTSVLRTNRQIYAEARSIFFGKNIFHISSMPPTIPSEDDEGSGAFEPPLQLADLPLIRHLEIDLLYFPKVLRILSGPRYGGWTPICPAAERYVASLSYLLIGVKKSLLSLRLCADIRRYAPCTTSTGHGSWDSVEEEDLDMKKMLTGFHMADRICQFKDTISTLSFRTIGVQFDFPESCFGFKIEKEVLCKTNMVSLAGQVLVARNEIEMKAMMSELGEDEGNGVWDEGIVDLWPSVTTCWPRLNRMDGVERKVKKV